MSAVARYGLGSAAHISRNCGRGRIEIIRFRGAGPARPFAFSLSLGGWFAGSEAVARSSHHIASTSTAAASAESLYW